MNYWTGESIKIASQRNYLDELFKVYPISPNIKRTLEDAKKERITEFFNQRQDEELVKELLKCKLFPLKDAYVAYLKKDKTSLGRNPKTINRLTSYLYDMGLEEIIDRCEAPIETNRQMGSMFKNWVNKGNLGASVCKNKEDFLKTKENAILCTSDDAMKAFATDYLGYTHTKGLDFIARFNAKYVFGEAKFITAYGGHQNSQFADAINTLKAKLIPNSLNAEVLPIAIMDGVLYIPNKGKMYSYISSNNDNIIISALLLREFLFSI